MKISWWNCNLGDNAAKNASYAIVNRYLSDGDITNQLEKEICRILGSKYCLVTTSGTSALLLSLIALGINKTSNVILPSCSWISTANAPSLLGCQLRFTDVDPRTGLLNLNEIEKLIDKNTKAIIPVHLNGRYCLTNKIIDECKKSNIPILEDACQAFASETTDGQIIGSNSQIACFSFGVTKLVTCGQGGCLVTSSDEFYQISKKVKYNGLENYLFPKYEMQGLNFKQSDILSSLLFGELKNYRKYKKRVTDIYDIYRKKISNKNIFFTARDPLAVPLYSQVQVKPVNRKSLLGYAKDNGIELREVPPCYGNSKYFNSFDQNRNFEGANSFCESTVYLPSGPGRSNNEIDYVSKVLNDWKV